LRAAGEQSGLWDELAADWLLLDAELLPWSFKAEGLLRDQYRPVGAGAESMYAAANRALEQAAARGLAVDQLAAGVRHRWANAAAYSRMVARYAWAVEGLHGIEIAPFQILASSSGRHYDEPHSWHLAMADRLVAADPALIRPTRSHQLDPGGESAIAEAVTWWDELTAGGAEGMVVKPMRAPVKQADRLVQPGLKVRGREYLRMTYGPDYLDRLAELRQRRLSRKRSLALREYALGLESIDRVVAGEPLWRRHEAVFAVLALEAEPTDPRL
jgi:hypothetical protein